MEGAAARVASTVVREAGRRVSKQALEVSEAAAARVAELLSQRDKPFLKLSVKTRGCSGLSYSMSYAGACDTWRQTWRAGQRHRRTGLAECPRIR